MQFSKIFNFFLLCVFLMNSSYSIPLKTEIINFQEKLRDAQASTIPSKGSLIKYTIPFAEKESQSDFNKNFDIRSDKDVLDSTYVDLMKNIGRNDISDFELN